MQQTWLVLEKKVVWIHFVQLHKAAAYREKHRLTLQTGKKNVWPLEFWTAVRAQCPGLNRTQAEPTRKSAKLWVRLSSPSRGPIHLARGTNSHLPSRVTPDHDSRFSVYPSTGSGGQTQDQFLTKSEHNISLKNPLVHSLEAQSSHPFLRKTERELLHHLQNVFAATFS